MIAQSDTASELGSKKSLRPGAPFSTSFLRLTLSQYRKAFGLSATPVAYYPLVSIPHFVAIDSPLYLNISKIGLSPN